MSEQALSNDFSKPNPNKVINELSDLTVDERLQQLEWRKSHQPKKIDNAKLYAGSPMYYYCKSCGWLSEILPEGWWKKGPTYLCPECTSLKKLGYLK